MGGYRHLTNETIGDINPSTQLRSMPGGAGAIISFSGATGTPILLMTGTAGKVLTANGSGNYPTWQNAPAGVTFLGLSDTPSGFSNAGAIYCANGTPDAVAESTVILAESTNTFSITKGTASLDIAAGATLNIDKNLTVNTAAVTLNQSLQTTDHVQFANLTATGTTTIATAISGMVKSTSGVLSAGTDGTDYLSTLVADTTPQLGGTLDCQENNIDNVGDIIHDDSVASDWTLKNEDQDKDIIFSGNDGGAQTDIMKLDVSEGQLSGIIKATSGVLGTAVADTDYLVNISADSTPQLGGTLDCQENEIDNVGDITHDDGTASDWTLKNIDQDKDIIFSVNDGGAQTTVAKVDGDISTFEVVENLKISKQAYYDAEVDNGNSGSTATIDWTAGNCQKITMTANCTFSFTNPTGPGHYTLRMIQDGTGGRTSTWTGGGLSILWNAGSEVSWSTTAAHINIATFYYSGSAWYADGWSQA